MHPLSVVTPVDEYNMQFRSTSRNALLARYFRREWFQKVTLILTLKDFNTVKCAPHQSVMQPCWRRHTTVALLSQKSITYAASFHVF